MRPENTNAPHLEDPGLMRDSRTCPQCPKPTGMYLRVEFWSKVNGKPMAVFDGRKHTLHVAPGEMNVADACSISTLLAQKMALKWNWIKIRLINAANADMKGCKLKVTLTGSTTRELRPVPLLYSESTKDADAFLKAIAGAAKSGFKTIKLEITATSKADAEAALKAARAEAAAKAAEAQKAEDAKKAAEAEAARLADEAKKAADAQQEEAARIAAEKKKAADAEAARQAELQRQADAAAKAAQVEADRQAEIARRAEETRIALEQEQARRAAAARLGTDQTLPSGSCMTSANGCFRLCNQTDGNLVIYNRSDKVLWAQKPRYDNGEPRGGLRMQSDGNLVFYNGANPVKAKWTSGTDRKGNGPYELVMQDDGNLVASGNGVPIWASDTYWSPCS